MGRSKVTWKSFQRYTVLVRSHLGLVTELVVEAEDAYMAHKAAMGLRPHARIVRIAPAPPEFDGEDW
jgi:hypothetical protein